jgi:chemotaxis protein MotB
MENGTLPGTIAMNSENQPKTEILIIRRVSNDDGGGHHGGAWKIAYADFVTAMMAFFLVMWLINSANEATRARVASYFNPIKMTDATPSGKELKDISSPKKFEAKPKPENIAERASDAVEHSPAETIEPSTAPSKKTSGDPLHDPYKTIEQIASEGQAHPSGRVVEVVSEKSGDPFDPKAWEVLREGKQSSDEPDVNRNLADPSPPSTAHLTQDSPAETPENSEKPIAPKAVVHASDTPLQTLASRTVLEIQKAIDDAGAATDLKVSAKVTTEGLLIVLSDKKSQPMFSLGAAKPTPALIEVINTIGKILNAQFGRVVVRGHTDARQYRNESFDNWQLSTARAHMASYILIRGGLEEKRILKIEGFGSSDPIEGIDPLADENRRVEFLLKKQDL